MLSFNFLLGKDTKKKVARRAYNPFASQQQQVKKALSEGKLISMVKN